MKKCVFILTLLIICSNAFAQDIIVTNDGETIRGYNTDCSTEWVYYSLDSSLSVLKKIACKDVIAIKKANGEKIVPNQTFAKRDTIIIREVLPESIAIIPNDEAEDSPTIDQDSIDGFLLKQGNCVCIPHNSLNEFERVGQNYIYNEVKKLGYWKVVNRPEQAHFIIYFGVSLKGRDHAFTWIGSVPFFMNDKGSYDNYKVIGNEVSDETAKTNLQIAKQHMFELRVLLEDLKKGKVISNLVINKDRKKIKHTVR